MSRTFAHKTTPIPLDVAMRSVRFISYAAGILIIHAERMIRLSCDLDAPCSSQGST